MSLLLGCSFETILLIKKELRLKGLCMFVIIRFSTCQVKTFSPFVDKFPTFIACDQGLEFY